MSDAQDRIHSALQEVLSYTEQTTELKGGMLVGWVAVTEWIGSDGDRWLSVANSDAKTWTILGYLHSALNTVNAADTPEDE